LAGQLTNHNSNGWPPVIYRYWNNKCPQRNLISGDIARCPGANWRNALRDSKGSFWRIFFILAFAIIPLFLLAPVFGLYRLSTGESSIATVSFQTLIDFLTLTASAGVAAVLYPYYAQKLGGPPSGTVSTLPVPPKRFKLIVAVTLLGILAVSIWYSTTIDFQQLQISTLTVQIRHNPDEPDPIYARGLLFSRQGDNDRAIEDFERVTQLRPNRSTVWNSLCWSRAIVGQIEAALSDCNEAVRLDPDNSDFLDSRGLVYLKKGELDRAIVDYHAALQRDPKKAYSLYGRGLARTRKSENVGAADDIAAAKAINPHVDTEFRRLGVQ
jgi:tetratricopeptide (TPR) repeat protein